ncbi:hypothetical protein ES707_16333 [subsurface metagenome]
MTIKKFTKVEARVNTYLAEHKGVSYKEACFAVLNNSDGLGETKRNPYLRPGGGLSLIERFPVYKDKKKSKKKR